MQRWRFLSKRTRWHRGRGILTEGEREESPSLPHRQLSVPEKSNCFQRRRRMENRESAGFLGRDQVLRWYSEFHPLIVLNWSWFSPAVPLVSFNTNRQLISTFHLALSLEKLVHPFPSSLLVNHSSHEWHCQVPSFLGPEGCGSGSSPYILQPWPLNYVPSCPVPLPHKRNLWIFYLS